MPEHFSSRALNLVSQTACTGSQYLPAVGAAKALKTEGSDAVVYVESGEGATSEGEFFESLNWAARESLPLLYVIQNNGYAISVPQRTQTISSVNRIAELFGVRSVEIDGISFEEIYAKVSPLIQHLRAGKGPVLIEALVVRIDPHSSSDDHRKHRCVEDIENCVGRRILEVDGGMRVRSFVPSAPALEALGIALRRTICTVLSSRRCATENR